MKIWGSPCSRTNWHPTVAAKRQLVVVEALKDFSHLIREDFSEEDAYRCVIQDTQRICNYLPEHHARRLAAYCELPVIHHEINYGCRTEEVPGVIDCLEATKALELVGDIPENETFTVRSSWESDDPEAEAKRCKARLSLILVVAGPNVLQLIALLKTISPYGTLEIKKKLADELPWEVLVKTGEQEQEVTTLYDRLTAIGAVCEAHWEGCD